ncbi:MAG TPA: NAD-dependent epimerase/dehydratase family protein [Chloroflexota bacterium]|nr:NAD-dependent epimerase/dehydratase family protein [Chloroflexota bacterium]
MAHILVTGGAGFIGSHLVDALIERGHRVRVLDNLSPQVHGRNGRPPAYLHPRAEFMKGDVRSRQNLRAALEGIEIVFHQAAAVGVGQSMYEIRRYVDVNTYGGAVLLDLLANERHQVRKVIVASSMSIYGEGAYACTECGPVYPALRSEAQLRARDWEMRCPHCQRVVQARPTPEDKPLAPTSIYAITKRDHEEMFLAVGRAYRLPTVALRYFNVYGPRQALSNPYTGVAAIFAARLLNGRPPLIFEDGLQTRDFTHVRDIVQANLLAMESDAGDYEVFNVGTGVPTTVRRVAELLAQHLGVAIAPEIVQQFRAGDIRHCYADISKIQRVLGYRPTVPFEAGIADLVAWAREQRPEDSVERARQELEAKCLIQ